MEDLGMSGCYCSKCVAPPPVVERAMNETSSSSLDPEKTMRELGTKSSVRVRARGFTRGVGKRKAGGVHSKVLKQSTDDCGR
jgi:hypothetical protein